MYPKVSICMPNYNYAHYLPDAIESALNQTYKNFEFIIIDNCSTDNSVEIISRYAELDSRIRFSVNQQNIGLVNNMNLCLRKAQGDYIKYLFSDDLLASPGALGKMVSVLDSNKRITLVATSRNIIDERSVIKNVLSEYKEMIGYKGTDIIQDCLVEQKNKIGEPSVVLFRKSQAECGFDSRYKQAVDLAMWLHLLEQGDFAYLDDPLCSFRVHPQQQTRINITDVGLIEEPFMLLNDYGHKPYVKISRLTKEYMSYVPVYSIWKLYKKQRITKKDAIDKIKEHYSILKFTTVYPFFKIYKLLKKTAESFVENKKVNVLTWIQRRNAERYRRSSHEAIQAKKKYYDYTRTEILPLLPETVTKVLDVGCGSGNTLVWLKGLKRCAWIGGVDISPLAVKIAQEKLDAIYSLNIEQNLLPIQESTLDLILCLDVLEHMHDPWEVVRRLCKLLKPGGALIVSIPNVRNRKVLFPLIFKQKWDYQDAGFLDRTHLRFFVRETAIDLVESSGLKVDMVAATGLGRSRRSKVINTILPSIIKSLFEKQYLIRGIKID